MGYIGQNFNPADLPLWTSKYRPEAMDYKIGIVTTDGAMNDPSNPGIEAALDTQTVAGVVYPLPSGGHDSFDHLPLNVLTNLRTHSIL